MRLKQGIERDEDRAGSRSPKCRHHELRPLVEKDCDAFAALDAEFNKTDREPIDCGGLRAVVKIRGLVRECGCFRVLFRL
jgi:hypothetical protein